MEEKDWEQYLQDPRLSQTDKDELQEYLSSFLTQGQRHESEGDLKRALEEYQKENDRPIHTTVDADIRQTSFWYAGNIYRQLGEAEKAISAYQEALDLFNQYGVGHPTYQELAEMYLVQGMIKETIELCEEGLEHARSWGLRQLLNQARSLLDG